MFHIGYNLVAAGHSLGGAIASLAAGSFKANFPFANVTLYTYGERVSCECPTVFYA